MTADMLADSEQSFQDALNDVERRVESFAAKSEAEATSKAEKLKALYDALEQAYAFHTTWVDRAEYQAMLADKGIAIKNNGRSSAFTPTIKALFDPALDRFETAGDADKRREKVRRQKTVSAYCSSLELAQQQGRADVSKLLTEKNGIEAARKEWAKLKPNPVSSTKPSSSKMAKFEAGLRALTDGMRQILPDAPENAQRTFLAVMYTDEKGKSHILGQIEEGKASRRLIDNFVRGKAPSDSSPSLDQAIADLTDALRGSPSAAEIKKVLGAHKALWPIAVKFVKEHGDDSEEPVLGPDAKALHAASIKARRMWGLYDQSSKGGFLRAAEKAAEDAREHWEQLSPEERALFAYIPNSERTPEDDREVPVLRKRPGLSRAELNSLAGELCLERLRELQSGPAGVAAPLGKWSPKEAQARLKRLQDTIGKPGTSVA